MTNLDSIFKSRDITWPTKFHLVKAMVFPVVMYGCESWTVKKAERRRVDAFELEKSWRRLLRVPWTARRSNQSILKISSGTIPWTAARQAPLSMGSSRQEYWRGLPIPSPGSWLPQAKTQIPKPETEVDTFNMANITQCFLIETHMPCTLRLPRPLLSLLRTVHLA